MDWKKSLCLGWQREEFSDNIWQIHIKKEKNWDSIGSTVCHSSLAKAANSRLVPVNDN